MMLLHKDLTHAVIGAYYSVYNNMSHSYPEYIYERAMAHELASRGIRCRRQETYEVFYKEKKVGEQRLDMFVADEVVVELKVGPELTDLHRAQGISYLKVAGKQVGLLFNFGASKPDFQRLYFEPRAATNDPGAMQSAIADVPASYLNPGLTAEIIGGLFTVHSILGPGFIRRIYANACFHELGLRGLEVKAEHEMQVVYKGAPVGEIKFNHLCIAGAAMVFPVAVRHLGDVRLNNLKDWMRIQHVPLAVLANFYATSLDPQVVRA